MNIIPPFDLQANFYVACGGFGDALMVLNKFKYIEHISQYKFFRCLHYFCWHQEHADLVSKFFALNLNQHQSCIHLMKGANLGILKQHFLHKRNLFNVAWNGNPLLDEFDKLRDVWLPDIPIYPFMQFKGDEVFNFPDNFYIFQWQAGVEEDRRKFNNKSILEILKVINKKYNLKCVVIAPPPDLNESVDFIFPKNMETIEYIKKAKFIIAQDGFVSILALMSKVPCIMKVGDPAKKVYFGHPEWQPLMYCMKDQDDAYILQSVKTIISKENCSKSRINSN